ncbi:hypothetical protein D9M68_810020 [compost metagenome]
MVGVAQVQGALGHAVKTHHQLIGLAVVHPVRADLSGQGFDVAGVVVVAVDEAQLGQMAHLQAPGGHRVEHAGGGGAAVLRVGRHDQHARHALGLEFVEHGGDGRVAVAHGVAHRHLVAAFAQVAAQQRGLPVGPHLER